MCKFYIEHMNNYPMKEFTDDDRWLISYSSRNRCMEIDLTHNKLFTDLFWRVQKSKDIGSLIFEYGEQVQMIVDYLWYVRNWMLTDDQARRLIKFDFYKLECFAREVL